MTSHRKPTSVIIPDFPRYRIYPSGTVIDTDNGNKTVTPIRDRFHTQAVILGYPGHPSKTVHMQVARLLLISYKPLAHRTPLLVCAVKYLDGNKENIELSNLEWDLGDYIPKFVPGKNIGLREFVRIPGFKGDINSVGEVRRDGHIVKIYDRGGYMAVNLRRRSDSKCVTVGLHRLLALTFLRHPIITDGLVINHIDGNPLNNSLSNIEWCTYTRNITHARDAKLRDDYKPIVVMNIETRKTTKYQSLMQFCREHDLDDSSPWDRLRHNRPIYPYHGFYIKYQDDLRPWPKKGEMIDLPIGPTPTQCKNVRTGEVLEFETIADLAKHFGKDTNAVKYQLDKPVPTLYFGTFVRRKSDKPWPVLDVIPEVETNRVTPILAKNIHTGEVFECPSLQSASSVVGRTASRIKHHIETKDPAMPLGDYLVKYKRTDSKWPNKIIPNPYDRLVYETNLKTGDVVVHKSMTELANRLQVWSAKISYNCKRNGHFIHGDTMISYNPAIGRSFIQHSPTE